MQKIRCKPTFWRFPAFVDRKRIHYHDFRIVGDDWVVRVNPGHRSGLSGEVLVIQSEGQNYRIAYDRATLKAPIWTTREVVRHLASAHSLLSNLAIGNLAFRKSAGRTL
jgi:hypothetical protein